MYVQSSDLTIEQHSVYFKTFQVFQDLLHVWFIYRTYRTTEHCMLRKMNTARHLYLQ